MTLQDTYFLLKNLDYYLKKSEYKLEVIIKSTNLSRPTFYKKKREMNFTFKEIIKMLPYIKPQEAQELEDTLLYELMTAKDINYLTAKESQEIIAKL